VQRERLAHLPRPALDSPPPWTRRSGRSPAIAKVTGEDPEDIKGTLNGQIESEIDPAKIYQRAMVEGDLNKQTQKEIEEAVERARKAYEIATQSLFRDVSSYSFDHYQRELAADLTLADLQRFAETFLSMHRRQVQRKGPFLEFLVPDVLSDFDLSERYRTATFDRELAIHRSEAEFLALGHPFVDAMLAYVGSYDFGGLTACRRISAPNLKGRSGFLFVFILRQRITNGALEGMNNRVKLVSHRSYGFRNDDRYIEAIYHNCAALPLPPDG
jgi:hypothetical protein